MKWTKQQAEALKAVYKWLKDPDAPQIFRLFGYAGTGKTTLAKHIDDFVHEEFEDGFAQFCAFTGKASEVLRLKDCANASTIHSLIYQPIFDDPDEPTRIIGWAPRTSSPIRECTVVIVDEGSMVNDEIGKDLLSFNKKILVLADPFQLQPVSGEAFFTDAKYTPDYMLTDIRRQEKDNPIIAMSIAIREGHSLKPGKYGDSEVFAGESPYDHMRYYDQVLVGKNVTRHALNASMRRSLKYRSPFPMKGEELICLKNERELGIYNGSQWKVLSCRLGEKNHLTIHIESMTNEDHKVAVAVCPELFEGKSANELDFKRLKGTQQFDFGYAITTHKSQGSQWEDVMVVDESRVFREFSANWLYTAITRASNSVGVFL